MAKTTSLSTEVKDKLLHFKTAYTNQTPLIKFLETLSHNHFQLFICQLAKHSLSLNGTYTFPGDDRRKPDSLKVPVTQIDILYIVEKCAWAIVLRSASGLYIRRVIELIGDQGERFGLEAVSRGVNDLVRLAYLPNFGIPNLRPKQGYKPPRETQICLAEEIETLNDVAKEVDASWTGHQVDKEVYWMFRALCDKTDAYDRVRYLVHERA
jgi:hypothetical protein